MSLHYQFLSYSGSDSDEFVNYRCDMEDILLEMDRILRPEGTLLIRDDVDMLLEIQRITDGMEWESRIVDHEDSPHYREKILFAHKKYWTAPAPAPAPDKNSS